MRYVTKRGTIPELSGCSKNEILSEMVAAISKRSGNEMEKICSNRYTFTNNEVEIERIFKYFYLVFETS